MASVAAGSLARHHEMVIGHTTTESGDIASDVVTPPRNEVRRGVSVAVLHFAVHPVALCPPRAQNA